MFAVIINRLRGKMEAEVPRIFGAVFECTLQMITRNFEVRCVWGGGVGWGGGAGGWGCEWLGKGSDGGCRSCYAPRPGSTQHSPLAAATVLPCPAPCLACPLQDYPEHRLQFFSLLRAITNHCSTTLFAMSPVGGGAGLGLGRSSIASLAAISLCLPAPPFPPRCLMTPSLPGPLSAAPCRRS
jgi:hypothetical protein